MLTKSLAVEWAQHNIRVNSISPGYILTEAAKKFTDYHSFWKERPPQKRLGNTEEIGEIVAFLASDKCHFATGADWIADGGYTCP